LTLFGKTLDAEQIAGLVALLALLLFWIVALRREQGALTGFRQWEADRKARRDAELARENGEEAPPSNPPSAEPRRGPWG
jgi:hypothetical protein